MNAMVTFPDRAGSVSWDLASPGGRYEISRQCSDERATTPAHPPELRPLSGAGTATGRQCGHDREMDTAAGAPGCLQSSPPHSQSPAPRTRTGAGGAAPGVVVGSGRRVAGPASESLPPTQSLGGVSGVGALAVAARGGLAAPGPAGARPLSGLSPGVLAPGCLLPAPPRWAPALSVSRHRPRRAIAASDVCLRTLLQRASPVQSHGRPNAASAHAPLVCQTTATVSPGTCAHVHNVVTLDS